MKKLKLKEGAISGSDKTWTYQELADLERKFDDFLKKNNATNIRFDGAFNRSHDRISDIVMEGYLQGDWKHEHLAFKELVKEFAQENNLIIINLFSKVTDDAGSDWYTAYYSIPMIKKTESAQSNFNGFRKLFSEKKSIKESYNDDEIKVYMNTWANYNEYGADLVMYDNIDGWMSIEDAIEFAKEHAEDEPFINDTDNIPRAFNIDEYSPVISTLELLQRFQDSGADSDILEAIMESGYSSLEDALDKYEDGDYYWYPDVSSYTELAYAVIDESGGLSEALGDRVLDYIDEDQMRSDYEWDVREMMRDDAKQAVRDKHKYDDEEDYDEDEEIEEWIDDNFDSYMDAAISDELEAAARGEVDLSNYFDYEKFGRDLSYDGYVFTNGGAILCEVYKTSKRAKNLSEKLYKRNGHMRESVYYYSGKTKLTQKLKKTLNDTCRKYSGWKLPQEVRPLWDELFECGIDDISIEGYPDQIAEDGGKSWSVPFSIKGELVTNSRFIYQVYEGSNRSLKNDYNIYFS